GQQSFTFKISEKDDAGAKAISSLRDRGINPVSNAVAQSAEHIMTFFSMLRGELGFYLGAAALHQRLTQQGLTVCFPAPAPAASSTRATICATLRWRSPLATKSPATNSRPTARRCPLSRAPTRVANRPSCAPWARRR